MRYTYHEIGELERKGQVSFAGPREWQGPGKPVRTYTQSQFVGCLLALMEAAEAAAGGMQAGSPVEAQLRRELANAAKFLEQQGIKTK